MRNSEDVGVYPKIEKRGWVRVFLFAINFDDLKDSHDNRFKILKVKGLN